MVDAFLYGGPLEQLVSQWAQMGVFTVILPFILVFAIVFAILEKIELLKNKGVHVIIALAIAFFTISNPYATAFFVPLFSNLGLGVAILICLMIVVGLAIKPGEGTWRTLFLIVGILIFILVIVKTQILKYFFGGANFYCSAQCQALIIFFVIIVLAVVAALVWGKNDSGPKSKSGDMVAAPRG
jgi:hypothetical protein